MKRVLEGPREMNYRPHSWADDQDKAMRITFYLIGGLCIALCMAFLAYLLLRLSPFEGAPQAPGDGEDATPLFVQSVYHQIGWHEETRNCRTACSYSA